MESEVTNAKSDLARALIMARRSERLAAQATREKEEKVSAFPSADYMWLKDFCKVY